VVKPAFGQRGVGIIGNVKSAILVLIVANLQLRLVADVVNILEDIM
jgi:hypothetical protein